MMEYSQSRTSSNVRAGIAYTPSLVVSPPSDSGLQESLNVGHSPNSGGIER